MSKVNTVVGDSLIVFALHMRHTTVCVLRATVCKVTGFCIELVMARCTTVSKVNMVVGDSLIVSDVYA